MAIGFVVVSILLSILAMKAASAELVSIIKQHEASIRIGFFEAFRWMFLAASGAAMLVAISQVLAWTLATAPLVWVLPLAVYLLTFIVAFRWEIPQRWRLIALLAFLSLSLSTPFGSRIGHPFSILVWGLGLMLSGGLLLHGRLAQAKPPKAQLTAYYLFISVGGACGGAATALLPPILFHRFYELPMASAPWPWLPVQRYA